jgi:thiaminase
MIRRLWQEGGLFSRLREAAALAWQADVGHGFVRQSGAGRLPEAAARHHLEQDCRSLIQDARFADLAKTISYACRLETDFWRRGLAAA